MPRTPGPWIVSPLEDQFAYSEIRGPADADGTCDILGSTIGPDRRENARAIAGLPALIQAAREAFATMMDMLTELPSPDDHPSLRDDGRQYLRDAARKRARESNLGLTAALRACGESEV